jgi:chorismate mutase
LSEELSDFLQLVAEEKAKVKAKPKKVARTKPDMSELFKQLAELKEQETKKAEVTQEQLLQFEQIFSPKNVEAIIEEVAEEVEAEELVEEVIEPVEEVKEQTLVEKSLGLLTSPSDEKNSDPLTPLNQEFVTQKDFQKHYTKIIERIQQQLSTVGGGGETRLSFMDTATTLVTSSSYEVSRRDYYIGVNYAGAVTITLPVATKTGKTFVVKDESGEAGRGTNRYITVLPAAGDLIDSKDRAILAYDWGSLTFVWRGDSWRVI